MSVLPHGHLRRCGGGLGVTWTCGERNEPVTDVLLRHTASSVSSMPGGAPAGQGGPLSCETVSRAGGPGAWMPVGRQPKAADAGCNTPAPAVSRWQQRHVCWPSPHSLLTAQSTARHPSGDRKGQKQLCGRNGRPPLSTEPGDRSSQDMASAAPRRCGVLGPWESVPVRAERL